MAITIYEATNNFYKIVKTNEYLDNISPNDKIVQIDTPKFLLRDSKPFDSNSSIKKPKGTWYAYGTSWLELMGITSKPDLHLFKISINMDSMLQITDDNISIVCEKYGVVDEDMGVVINWNLVAEDYGGVDIKNLFDVRAGYRKVFKSHSIPFPYWLDAWDIPSGCIWNSFIINGFTKI
jgi:hypothetical protein